MAYQTGVSSTLTDLVTTMITFAGANGFTAGPTWNYTDASIIYDVRTLLKNGVYYMFAIPRTGTTYLFINSCTVTPSTGTMLVQGGAHVANQRVSNLIGPHVGYHFFGDGNCVNVAVEIVTNVFVHINFGEMIKNGTYTGGQYVTALDILGISGNSLQTPFAYAQNQLPFDTADIGSTGGGAAFQGHVRTPVAGPTVSLGRSTTSTRAYSSGLGLTTGRPMVDVSPNTINGRAVLVPINIVQSSSADVGPYYQLGYVGNARFVNIANLNAKEMVNTDWMVFPISQKNGPGTVYLSSLNYGMAYRK